MFKLHQESWLPQASLLDLLWAADTQDIDLPKHLFLQGSPQNQGGHLTGQADPKVKKEEALWGLQAQSLNLEWLQSAVENFLPEKSSSEG